MKSTGTRESIRKIYERVSVATEDSPIAVFRSYEGGVLTITDSFANTNKARIKEIGSGYIGSFDKSIGLEEFIAKVSRAVRS